MTPQAFVYTELQLAVPFADAPWAEVNKTLLEQPGLLNKTWLAGVGNHSLGGIYAFDSLENATAFVTGYFPGEARRFGVAQTTRLFEAGVIEEASRDMNSPHFGGVLRQMPGAYVYTEIQASVPFEQGPWRKRNPVLKQVPGLMSKTWLSGLNTQSIGGLDAFDTIENATAFAVEAFPGTPATLGAAYTTRIFDGAVVEQASRQMRSPFYA
ncbi:YdhR family protein [Thalassospiraceae bacterium LMO-SO8]|nr:YdhR family protein [Alphaproteobacteria bacterium LMO-S08]WND75913.1 YdhR family protein [Thalassospiraceae bacterium LMO-SO8]